MLPPPFSEKEIIMKKSLWAILLVVGLASSRTIAAETLQVGAAASVITPPVGTPMSGYYFERAAEGVHDDIFAKALVLDRGGTRVALVSLDLISTPVGLVASARCAKGAGELLVDTAIRLLKDLCASNQRATRTTH
jgi:hypothetical protein